MVLRFKKSANFIILTESETAKVYSCKMKNIVKGPNLSPRVTNFDEFLNITFLNDKPPLKTKSELRINWITLPLILD